LRRYNEEELSTLRSDITYERNGRAKAEVLQHESAQRIAKLEESLDDSERRADGLAFELSSAHGRAAQVDAHATRIETKPLRAKRFKL
jgi:hypothetical protein